MIVAEGLAIGAPIVATAVAVGAGEGLGVVTLHPAIVAETSTANIARRRFLEEPISNAPSCPTAYLKYRSDDGGGRSRVIALDGGTVPLATRRPG
jgi:hypothetical protein